MTLLDFDGFEAGDAALRYTNGASLSLSSSTRFGSGSCLAGAASFTRAFAAKTEIYIGVAFNVTANMDATARALLYILGDGAISQLTIGVRAAAVELRRGQSNGTLIATGALASSIANNTWHHLQVYATIADSGGRCIVKIDDTTVIDYTGDTKNAGSTNGIEGYTLQGNGTSVSWDDFWICDGQGSAPHNTFLGDCRVYTAVPTAAGNSTQMTPSTGQNWATQDELPYSATDYVTGAVGQKDTYTLGDIPSTVTTIYGVQINSYAKKTDAGSINARVILRSGSTDFAGDTTSLAVSDSRLTKIYTTDPNTSAAFTRAAVNALEAGTEVLA